MASVDHVQRQAAVEPGDDEGAEHADAGALGRGRPAGEDRAEHDHHQEGHREQAAPHRAPELGAGLRPVVGGELRRQLGLHHRDDEDVDEIEARQQQARHRRRREQRAGRGVEHLRHHHQHDGRRDQDAERAGRRDGAERQLLVVAGRQHLRQRDQRQQHHRGADHADRRGQDRAHHHDRDREPARHALEQDLGRRAACPSPSRCAPGSRP